MTTNVKLKEAFEVESKHGAFYTGGNIEWHSDRFYCQTANSISVVNYEDGRVLSKIGENEEIEDSDTIQTFTGDGERIVTSHKSGLLKLWNSQGELVKMWKYIHKGPIASLLLKEDTLASGGADGNVRLWDLNHQTCYSNLTGCQGVVNVIRFGLDKDIYASGDDGAIISWNYKQKNDGKSLNYRGHYSKVTGLVFSHDGSRFASCGRDKVIILWNTNQTQPLKILPVDESLETLCGLPTKFKLPNFKSDPDCFYVASGGDLGIVRIWDLSNTKEIYKQTDSLIKKSENCGLAVTKIVNREQMLAVISADHNIIVHNLKNFIILKQLVGFSDEILDLVLLGARDEYLAVASNSNDIKLYDNSSMSCELLQGHEDLVLSLATFSNNRNLLLSSSKDNTVRIWSITIDAKTCVGIGRRHNSSVGSISGCNLEKNRFFASASQDGCLKLWEPDVTTQQLDCKFTRLAHDKDINYVTISPNDRLISTASQDKTIKLWNAENLDLLGCLRGHKRGVWCAKFSPCDQIIASCSADCSIKLWSVEDFSCLKTLTGHESSVLKCDFLSNGLQILSTGADGLVKIFDVKSSECKVSYDEHFGRIWALVLSRNDDFFITGGSDSILIKWKDVSEEKLLERLKAQQELVLEEQKLNNYVQNDQLLKALKLALKLERPLQTLRIIQKISVNGNKEGNLLPETISSLKSHEKEKLFKFVCDWNTNSKNCASAQLILNVLLNELQSGDFKPTNLNSNLESILPYTDRHFKRLTQLMQDLNFINYTVNCMNPQLIPK